MCLHFLHSHKLETPQNGQAAKQPRKKEDMAADAHRGGDFGRNVTLHDSNQFWNSTGKHCWDSKMSPISFAFDQIAVSDLEGDNSLFILAQFAQRASRSPPLHKSGRSTHHPSTVAKSLETFVHKMCEKLFPPDQRESRKESLFPPTEVRKLSKQVKENTSRVLMESADSTDAFRKHFSHAPRAQRQNQDI